MLKLLLMAGALMLGGGMWAQEKPAPEKAPQEQPAEDRGFRFGVQVDQVFLSVNARGAGGGFVRGLAQDDFKVYEDGVEQEILNFYSEAAPANIALLIDASGSTRYSQGNIQAAAYRFAQSLSPEDRIAIITFNHQAKLILDWSNDLEKIDNRLKSIWAKGKTVLNDALYVTYDDLFQDLPGKKAIILLTDGVDFGSLVSARDVLSLAERSEATVYVVSLLDDYRQAAIGERLRLQSQMLPVPPQLQDSYIRESEAFLRRMAFNTGGRLFDVGETTYLTHIYSQVAEEIKNQYYLSYIPNNKRKEGKWRTIQIESSRLDVNVRTRPGYAEDSPAVESGQN